MIEAGSMPTTTEAILPIASAHWITISPSTLPSLDNADTYPYNFGAYPAQTTRVPGSLAIHKELGTSKNVAVLGSTVGASTVGGAIATAFKAAGLNVVSHQSVAETSTDDTVALQNAKSAGAAAIFLELLAPSAYMAPAMQGIKNLRVEDSPGPRQRVSGHVGRVWGDPPRPCRDSSPRWQSGSTPRRPPS